MQFITLLDYLLLPIYLVVIYSIARNFRNRFYPLGHPWRKFFLPALTVKIVGAILIGFVYQYYYGWGDTALYFNQSKILDEAVFDNPFRGFNLMLHIPEYWEGEYQQYISRMEWYRSPTTYMVVALSAFINLFTFSTFLPTSIIFASISFTGIWALFRTFALQYPQYLRPVAVAALFIPSCFMWGSGIFKDTICMFGLGWLTYGIFQMLVQRNFSLTNMTLSIISFLVLFFVKVYILLAFVPALSLWVVFTYSHKVSSYIMRVFIKIILAGITLSGFILLSNTFSKELGSYSLENITKTAEVTRSYVLETGMISEGSVYDLGKIDPSLSGMLSIFPKAIVIALFGPFVWEAKKAIVMMNALEASLFLFATIRVIVRIGFKRIWRTIVNDPNIQFFLMFTIIFGFAVGLTSGTYGSLSRYRIPCLPMFGLSIVLIYYQARKDDRLLFPFLKF